MARYSRVTTSRSCPGTRYVVNLLRPVAFTMRGEPYTQAIEEEAAPATRIDTAWMLALAGHVTDTGLLPEDTHVRVRNLRTEQQADLPIAGDGTFLGAFGDEDRSPVVRADDELSFELVSRDGYELGSRVSSWVGRDDLRRAYRMITLSARPDAARLLPNYPNPFNPDTWIPFALSDEAEVSLRIYAAQGALVRELGLGRRPAGYHVAREAAAHWDGRNNTGEPVSSGLYLCELRAGGHRDTRRVLLAK